MARVKSLRWSSIEGASGKLPKVWLIGPKDVQCDYQLEFYNLRDLQRFANTIAGIAEAKEDSKQRKDRRKK